MSANVWYEEVEIGLKKEILNTVKYLSSTGEVIPLIDDMVFVRDPEDDLRDEQIPCITITPLFPRFDPIRYSPEPVVMGKDVEHNTLSLEDPAVPFNLHYQLDFWTLYKEDMNIMTRTWLQKHFRQFNLSVVDDGGTERSSNVLLNQNLVESNLLRNQKRLFHSIISYVIWVELDSKIGYNKPMVAERSIEAEQKEE